MVPLVGLQWLIHYFLVYEAYMYNQQMKRLFSSHCTLQALKIVLFLHITSFEIYNYYVYPVNILKLVASAAFSF